METVTSKYVGRTEYSAAWEEQKRFFNALLDAKRNGGGQAEQVLLFVEHPHVYTLGKSGHASNLLVDDGFLKRIGATYFQTDRGGAPAPRRRRGQSRAPRSAGQRLHSIL